jgi:hypothetical protein
MHSFPRDWSADLDVRYARLRIVSHLHYQTVGAAHRLPFAIQQLLVEDVADEFHISLQ